MTRPALSLHHLSAMQWPVAQLADFAAAHGCQHVCLFGHVPPEFRDRYPLATAHDRRRLADAGVRVATIEVFAIAPDSDWSGFEIALDLAAGLGAGWINAHVHASHETPAERSAIVAQTSQLVAMAAERGLAVGLEPNPFSHLVRAGDSADIADRAGAEIIIDTLHFQRGGNGLSDLPLLAPFTRLVQVSDGPATRPREEWWREAMGGRMLPGEGALPLEAILGALHRLEIVSVEAPRRGLSGEALDIHIAEALKRSRALTAALSHHTGRKATPGAPS